MIVTNRITNKKVLEIFENFSKDRSLPKFNKKVVVPAGGVGYYADDTFLTSGNFIIASGTTSATSTIQTFVTNSTGSVPVNEGMTTENIPKKKGFLERVKSLFKRKEKRVNVNTVFTKIFENVVQIQEFVGREKYISEALEIAKKNGQTALVEKIEKMRETHMFESQLLSLGFVKVISEEQLIKFAVECEKGLRLDWIKNFTRMIPQDVIDRKERADQLSLFDNYVILHFDPENTNNALTKEDIEKKKDPILFGVCEHTRKLYYVGDWKDDYCNLTFDDLVCKIGEENLKINKKEL